jgi:hypothetical protein
MFNNRGGVNCAFLRIFVALIGRKLKMTIAVNAHTAYIGPNRQSTRASSKEMLSKVEDRLRRYV